MSQTDNRERSETCEGVLLLHTLPTRGEAVAWANGTWNASVDGRTQPFVPTAQGALDCGGWPLLMDGDPIELNEAKGRLPDDADLDYGVEASDITFHLLRRENDDRFSVLMSCDYVKYAKKLPETAATDAASG